MASAVVREGNKIKKLLIIKTGTTFPTIRKRYGDFEDHILRQLEFPKEDVVVAPVYSDKILPNLQDVSAIIITGSHSMVTDQDDWSIALASWLRGIRNLAIPILGICYGHQLLAHAFGGSVAYHPRGEEVGSVSINLTAAGKQDSLLGILPETFLGYVSHAQTVVTLPQGAKTLAKNNFESHHSFVIQDQIWGVQFHPEFNQGITSSYIELKGEKLVKEGRNVEFSTGLVEEHDYGKKLLLQFIKLAD
jgi:GMP synthase (glutamine-hydrolysing)